MYLDKPELFNKFVLEACARADEGGERRPAPLPAPATPALAHTPANNNQVDNTAPDNADNANTTTTTTNNNATSW